MKHICFCTFGSLGDIYPYIPIAVELKRRGFDVSVATQCDHRELVEKHGLRFWEVRPNVLDLMEQDPDVVKRIMDRRRGAEYVLREIVTKNIRASYEDLLRHCSSYPVDLFVTHPLTFHAILISRKLGIPYVSTVLSPVSLFSKYDAPAVPDAEFVPAVSKILGVGITGMFMNVMKNSMNRWFGPIREFQKELGLEVDKRNPLFEGQFSPRKNLALFSRVFAKPQADWPENTVVTGFPFLDAGHFRPEMDEKIERFLSSGAPPVVLTLGSSAVLDAGTFYENSVKALKNAGMRGLLLVGENKISGFDEDAEKDILLVEYAAHGSIFPRAAAIVHQGGVGTTGQALRSGAPQIVIPFGHDQFDNANRVVNLGCGLKADRHGYSAENAAALLKAIQSPKFKVAASSVAEIVRSEDGATAAADEILS